MPQVLKRVALLVVPLWRVARSQWWFVGIRTTSRLLVGLALLAAAAALGLAAVVYLNSASAAARIAEKLAWLVGVGGPRLSPEEFHRSLTYGVVAFGGATVLAVFRERGYPLDASTPNI